MKNEKSEPASGGRASEILMSPKDEIKIHESDQIQKVGREGSEVNLQVNKGQVSLGGYTIAKSLKIVIMRKAL